MYDYLKTRSFDLAARLHSYASGDGSLSFVWSSERLEDKGNAINEKVTLDDVRAFIATDLDYYGKFKIVELWGQILLVSDIKELSPNRISIDNEEFSIEKNNLVKCGGTGRNKYKIVVKHISTLAAWKFWEENKENWTEL